MHNNQIRDEGLEKHHFYMEEAAARRRARLSTTNETGTKATPIKRLGMAWVTVVNLLIGR